MLVWVDGAHKEIFEALIANGPPFDPNDLGFHRHAAYLTAEEVVFFFEAQQVEWIVNDMLDDRSYRLGLCPVEGPPGGPPRLAHERFYWQAIRQVGLGLGLT